MLDISLFIRIFKKITDTNKKDFLLPKPKFHLGIISKEYYSQIVDEQVSVHQLKCLSRTMMLNLLMEENYNAEVWTNLDGSGNKGEEDLEKKQIRISFTDRSERWM